jgi:rhodanese-related sulfurtransferase
MPESISVAELNALLATRTALLLDVRRAQAFAESPTIIPGALRRAPEHVADWAAELPRQQPLVVYCVHGHEVSQGVAAQLAELGLPVRFLAGGIAQWQAEGGVTVSPTD